MYLISCWIEHPVRQIDQPFTYTSDEPAECGMRVRVNFAHREVTGFVESCEETDETLEQAEARLHCRLKPVLSVLDQSSHVSIGSGINVCGECGKRVFSHAEE